MPKKGVIPPQFLKHPPKSWKGDMRRIDAEARADIRESRSIGRTMSGKKKSHRGGKRNFHLLPDTLMAMGAIAPAVNPNNTLISDVMSGNFRAVPDDLIYGYTQVDNLKPAVLLVVAGYAAKVVGKATGLNRVRLPGLKEVKLL